MKKAWIIFILMFTLFSCEKNNNTCNCSDPLTEIPWLTDLKLSLTYCPCQLSIIQATYEKSTVFYLAMTDPRCDYVFHVDLINCEGTTVKSYTDYNQFASEVTDRKVLYTCNTNSDK